MGDAENTTPSSLKRAAERELSRDNPDLDGEEDVCDQEAGTFKKASEEVLSNRKIVNISNNQAPVTVTSVQESQDNAKKEQGGDQEPENKVVEVERPEVINVQESQDNAIKEQGGDQEPANKVDEVEKPEVASESRKPESADAESAKEDAESESNAAVNDENKNAEKAATVTSFQQLSSSQNAFTGIVGTGFSSSTFSFGSLTNNDQPSFPSFSFGTNGNSSLFGPVYDKTEGSKTPSINKVEVETGEENEKAVFMADSVLFEFFDGGWKERGKGELKVNVSTTGNEKGRLVMRAKGNYRLILNASLFPDMKLTNMEKKGITFACLNSAGEGKDGLSTFALKFKDAAIVEEFRAIVTQYKVEVETGEENEKAVFTADSVLFEFLDGGWKERGKGELKVNVSTTGNEKGRLVMRAKGNYRLILNASLFPDMKLTNMEKKGITFVCLNSAGEGKDGLSTFALKFKDAAIVEEFRAIVTQYKGTRANIAVPVSSLRTPENSPKASDG